MKKTTIILSMLLAFAIGTHFNISELFISKVEAQLGPSTSDRLAAECPANRPNCQTTGGIIQRPGILPNGDVLRQETESEHGMLPISIVTSDGTTKTIYREKPGIHDLAIAIAQADIRFQGITSAKGRRANDYSVVSREYYLLAQTLFGAGEWVDAHPGE